MPDKPLSKSEVEEIGKHQHEWKAILIVPLAISERVVRWCRVCGAVRQDEDYDGRTNEGQYLGVCLPEVVRTDVPRLARHLQAAMEALRSHGCISPEQCVSCALLRDYYGSEDNPNAQ